MSFDEIRGLFQKCFDFPISLDRPYKLCDYKPVYGEALQAWLSEYDFWGHCDIDMIWGDIRKFATEELLSQYDRVCNQGHCSIYRNDERVNSLYRTLEGHGCLDWREVYSNDQNYAFDEYAKINPDGSGGGLSRIMEVAGERIFAKWVFANITTKYQARFQLSLDDHEREGSPEQIEQYEHRYYATETEAEMQFFERNQNGLFLWYCKDGVVQKKEFMYVHFAKRTVRVPSEIIQADNYLLVPPGKIVTYSEPLQETDRIKQMRKNHIVIRVYSYIQKSKIVQFVLRVKNKIKRVIKK